MPKPESTPTAQAPKKGFASRVFDSLVKTANNPNVRARVLESATKIGHSALEGMGIVTRDHKTGKRSFSKEGFSAAINDPPDHTKQRLVSVVGKAAGKEAGRLGAELVGSSIVRAFDRLLPDGNQGKPPASAGEEQSLNGVVAASAQAMDQPPAPVAAPPVHGR